jgi:hypothetical protein
VAIAVWRRTIHVSTTIVRRGLKAVVPECERRLIHWTADWHVCRALMTRISTGCPCNLILMLFCGVLQLVDRARTCQNGESAELNWKPSQLLPSESSLHPMVGGSYGEATLGNAVRIAGGSSNGSAFK